jgi:hypothetical protein
MERIVPRIQKNCKGNRFTKEGGPFLPRAKKCFTQHSPCKTGLKPAQPATRPVFRPPGWVGAHLRCRARGPWARAPGRRPPATRARSHGSRTRSHGSRTRDQAPGHQARGHQAPGRRPPGRPPGHQAPGTRHQAPGTRHQAPGTRARIMARQLVNVDIMPEPGSAPDYLIIAK